MLIELFASTAETNRGEAYSLILVGMFFLAGFAAHVLGRRVHVPRVTILLLMGFFVSPSALDLVPEEVSNWFPLSAKIALSIIGFQLGEQFLGKELRKTGKVVFGISLAEVLITAAVVLVALWGLGYALSLALLLAAVAPASAPAATRDVIREADAKGPVSDTVLGVVAVDDAWGVILFSILLAVARFFVGEGGSAAVVLEGFREVGGGISLGIAVGLPMAFLTGHVRPGELTLVESLGFVSFCSGVAIYFEFSHILACMAMGATVSNLAKHHKRPFHAIEEIEQPFLIVFFFLAGFDFEVDQLWNAGLIGLTYVVARSIGRILGGFAGGYLSNAPDMVRTHTGWCLLPQAGVALGLALMVSERHPEIGSQVLSITVGTTIIFELIGPLVTHFTLRHAGEISTQKSSNSEEAERQEKEISLKSR